MTDLPPLTTLITLSPCADAAPRPLLTLRQLPFRFELLDHDINASSTRLFQIADNILKIRKVQASIGQNLLQAKKGG